VPPERLEQVAAIVCAQPGVTHAYQREHAVNLWFTLTARSGGELERTLAELSAGTSLELWSLPAKRVYKISAQFPLTPPDHAPDPPAESSFDLHPPPAQSLFYLHLPPAPTRCHDAPMKPPAGPGDASAFDGAQRALARALQDDLPLCERPYEELADRCGRTQEWVLAQLRDWLGRGLLRRVAALARHRELGYTANAMVVFRAPPERLDQAGAALAQRADVTHCYHRQDRPEWPWNLYAMFHGQDRRELAGAIDAAARELGPGEHLVLWSLREFKKTSMVYF
jgi:DNA-binding Lrp family transcriptional regulator